MGSGQRQIKFADHLANRLVMVQGQRNDQLYHLLGRQAPPPMAQAVLAATRKPQLPDELEGVLELLAATR